MGKIIEIAGRGQFYLPTAWQDAVDDGETPKVFAAGVSLNALLKHLRLGRAALIEGTWHEMRKLLATVEARKKELLGYVEQPHVARERARDYWAEAYRRALARLLVTATPAGTLDTAPPVEVPYLLEFLGDQRHANQGLPLIVPILAVRQLQEALAPQYPVSGLCHPLVAPDAVLQPRQQDVYELMQEALLALAPVMPAQIEALDIGCGSGVLALLIATTWREKELAVWATDILPEALATTRLNVDRLVARGEVAAGIVHVTDGGDLYVAVGDRRFDLVAFNPPWANAPARTRLEVARYDWQQRTVLRFLAETLAHLKPGGHLLLFYSDNAGERVVAALHTHAGDAGLRLQHTWSRRIRVARKWEYIYLYDFTVG